MLVAQKTGAVTVVDAQSLLRGELSVLASAQTSLNGATGIVALTND